MPNPPDLFGALAASLAPRGWVASAEIEGIAFTREEPVTGGTIAIRLCFDPARLWLRPSATLKVAKGNPKDFSLHRFRGTFCYLDMNSVEWDPESERFGDHLMWAADFAIDELHRLQKNERIVPEDSEFMVHWAGYPEYLDISEAQWPPKKGSRIERLELPRPDVPASKPLAVYRLADGPPSDRYAAYETVCSKPVVPAVYVDLLRYPFPLSKNWPPENLSQLNAWLYAHDPRDNKRLWREIAEAMYLDKKDASNVYVVINTLAGRFGALLLIGPETMHGYRRGPSLAENLHGYNSLTQRIGIMRSRFERLDPDFVLKRNVPDGAAALAGKHIHLVGAGSIGGHLADLLVQAGAGSDGGSLHVFDADEFRPENLGRHLLGAQYLGLNKAKAVAAYLTRHRLATNVHGHAVFGPDARLHVGADLVIDATAAPYLGIELNNIARRERRWALLTVFVEGEGWIAGTYLYRGRAGEACRACLEPWIGGTGSHVRKEHQHQPRDNGCGSRYTPYRAAAATIAAAMASELACDWAQDRVSKRYRAFRLPNAPKHVADGRFSSPESKPTCVCAKPKGSDVETSASQKVVA